MPAKTLCILIPCLNEEDGIVSVVRDFHHQFPLARILVVDNGSSDRTVERARQAGAEIIIERQRGKARAVLSAFSAIDEDIVIMVDGDDTYPAEGAQRLLTAFENDRVDMVTGIRKSSSISQSAFRPMHQAGTSAFARVLSLVFGFRPADVFSGLRLFSKTFYKNVPIHSRGFELEMELTIQSIDKGFRMSEVDVPFRDRAKGSASKLRTVRDGLRILHLLLMLYRDYRPFSFFGSISGLIFIAGLAAGSLPIHEYITTRLVGRFPLAILAAALCNLAAFTFFTGLILESNLRHRREAYQVELRKFQSST
jgi:glycosyltransferase involved in cell wall biosynthesis